MKNNKIFVQVPSYRDRQLIPTLTNLIRTASKPDLLNVVVCWQHAEDEDLCQFEMAGFSVTAKYSESGDKIHQLSLNGSSVKLIDYNYLDGNGCGWARNKVQQYYTGEDYSLQIDSHHRFADAWDQILIDMLNGLRGISSKPVLTGYPPPYEPDNDIDLKIMEPREVYFKCFAPPGVVRFYSRHMTNWRLRQTPMRARFLSGGFVFADGHFVTNVPNDPGHFFATEEIIMSVRAYTHGYDLFHPHRLILWHQYGRESSPRVWHDHTSDVKSVGGIAKTATERSINSYLYSRGLLNMNEPRMISDPLAEYGFGTERTLDDYEMYAGLSFSLEGATQAAMDGLEPSGENGSLSRDFWEKQLISTMEMRILVKSSDVGDAIHSNDELAVTITSAEGSEIYRFELSRNDKEILRNGDDVIYELNFSMHPNEKPSQYTLNQKDAHGHQLIRATAGIEDELIRRYLAYGMSSPAHFFEVDS